MRWVASAADPELAASLSQQLSISPLMARLLIQRGIDEPAAAYRFLNPSLDQLHDPLLMTDMKPAVERLRRAIAQKEKVLIYGDYDVDGTMAVAVLLTALRSLGADADAHIPHRLADGYGMRAPVIEHAAVQGVRVVLSVDTGIREHQVIARARDVGIDVIVTDHHLPGSSLPPACAVLNPRRADCAYPDKNLSGVGVAFKLAHALLGSTMRDRKLESYLKIVALGTIADVVPLVGENRVIARFGLAALGSLQGKRAGLRSLLAVAGLAGRAINAADVAFRIAPRLNAAGRMESAADVIDLLTTPDDSKAREIAERLEGLNRERQRVEEEVLGEIMSRMGEPSRTAGRYSLVFSGDGWHRGVIGIVAQRVVDRYHRPALVIGIEDGIGYGSCRSIPGFHILDALTAAHGLSEGDALFERYGGHAQAAGFALRADRIQELEDRFEARARAVLTPEMLAPVLRVEAELGFAELGWGLYEQLQALEPFGAGNPRPIFRARGLRVVAPPRFLQDRHLRLKVAQNGKTFSTFGWEQAGRGVALAPGRELDLAFALEDDVFQEFRTLQLVMKDMKLP